jgi:hypothetical protein
MSKSSPQMLKKHILMEKYALPLLLHQYISSYLGRSAKVEALISIVAIITHKAYILEPTLSFDHGKGLLNIRCFLKLS